MRTYFIFSILSITLFSCLEELEDIDSAEVGTLNPDIALPVVNSAFTMEEFLKEGNSVAEILDENGVILIRYSDTLRSQGPASLIQIEDQTSPDLVISGTEMGAIPPNTSATFSRSATFNISSPDGDQLDSIRLSAGDLITSLRINAPVSGSVTLNFTSIVKNGQSVTQSISWTFDGSNSSQNLNANDDLADATIILTDGSGSSNEISFDAEFTITNEGTAVTPADQVRVSFGLSNLQFDALFGDIVNRPIDTPEDSELIDIFNNIQNGTFQLDDPRLELVFVNSFGIPAALTIDQIRAEAKDGSSISLAGDVITNQNPVELDAPTLAEIGSSKTTSFEINAQNSNLNDILSTFPERFFYRFPGEIDPLDVPNNFILSSSEISIIVNTELPLSGTISGLELDKLFDFDGNGISELNTATLIVNTSNTFPLDGRLQIYFLDDASNVLDSLYDDNMGLLMSAAEINSQGFSTAPGVVDDRVDIDSGEIDRIDQATQLRMRVTLQTSNGGSIPIKISSDNALQINMGIASELEIKI